VGRAVAAAFESRHRAGVNLVMSYSSLYASAIINLLQPGKLLMLSEGLNVFRLPRGRRSGKPGLSDQKQIFNTRQVK
jgi:hypothetical protein